MIGKLLKPVVKLIKLIKALLVAWFSGGVKKSSLVADPVIFSVFDIFLDKCVALSMALLNLRYHIREFYWG